MPTPRASSVAHFGSFTLDLKSGELNKHGKKIGLQEQPFRILTVMVEHPGELVTRDELRDRLWPEDTIVEFGHSINSAIKRLRDVLGDTADKPKYVETVARKGYRFLVPVDWEPVRPGDSMASITKPQVGSAPYKLVYTWRAGSEPRHSERVTVLFEPQGDATEVTVVHERILNAAIRDRHEAGWNGCLDGLANYLSPDASKG